MGSVNVVNKLGVVKLADAKKEGKLAREEELGRSLQNLFFFCVCPLSER